MCGERQSELARELHKQFPHCAKLADGFSAEINPVAVLPARADPAARAVRVGGDFQHRYNLLHDLREGTPEGEAFPPFAAASSEVANDAGAAGPASMARGDE